MKTTWIVVYYSVIGEEIGKDTFENLTYPEANALAIKNKPIDCDEWLIVPKDNFPY